MIRSSSDVLRILETRFFYSSFPADTKQKAKGKNKKKAEKEEQTTEELEELQKQKV